MSATLTYLAAAGVLYLLTSGLAGCYVSPRVGLSRGEGFLLGLLFGPIGLAVAAGLPAGAIAGAIVATPGDDEGDGPARGAVYHREGCRYLRGVGLRVTPAEARGRYRPCRACGPPR